MDKVCLPSPLCQVHFHFSEPMEFKDEVNLRSAIYLAAVSMLMGWVMESDVSGAT